MLLNSGSLVDIILLYIGIGCFLFLPNTTAFTTGYPGFFSFLGSLASITVSKYSNFVLYGFVISELSKLTTGFSGVIPLTNLK